MLMLKTLLSFFSSRNYVDITFSSCDKSPNPRKTALKPVLKPIKKINAKALGKGVKTPRVSYPRPVLKATTRLPLMKETNPASAPSQRVAGEVTHFFPKIQVAVVRAKKDIATGTRVCFKGPGTDLTQTITSMQIDHCPVSQAKAGEEFGLKLKGTVSPGDVCLFV